MLIGQIPKSIHETISDSILIVFSKVNLLNLVNYNTEYK